MYFETFKALNNLWYFRLKAANHETIVVSGDGYYNYQDCIRAINLIKKSNNAPIK